MILPVNYTKKFCFITFILLAVILNFGFHPFYLSVSELKYDSQKKLLQISVKQFTNDLEEVLAKQRKETVDLINGKDTTRLNEMVKSYIRKNFSLKINGKIQQYRYLGFEREEDATWAFFEINNCEHPKQIEVENSLLYELIKSQINIVHVDVYGVKKSLKVENPEKRLIFNF